MARLPEVSGGSVSGQFIFSCQNRPSWLPLQRNSIWSLPFRCPEGAISVRSHRPVEQAPGFRSSSSQQHCIKDGLMLCSVFIEGRNKKWPRGFVLSVKHLSRILSIMLNVFKIMIHMEISSLFRAGEIVSLLMNSYD